MTRRIPSFLLTCIMLIATGSIILQATADTEANKAFMVEYFDALSGKEKPAEIVNEYVSESDQALKDHIAMFEAGFPLYELVVDDMIAEGDKVAVRATFHGTHQGEFAGIPPTGVEATVMINLIYRIADGMIVEHWMEADQLGLMQQLGVVDPGSRGDFSWGASSEVTGEPGDPEENKAVVACYLDETWNQQNLGAVDELMSPDIVEHLATGGISVGIEAQKQTMTGYFATFPDIHVTINDMVAEGDKVAKRWTCTGTHQGELMGIPPTGRHITFTGITIYRFADSKIVELWWAWDVMGMMVQLTAPQEEINKVIAKRIYDEIWNQGNLAIADEIFATDFDTEEYKQLVSMYHAAFPDAHYTVEDQMAEGDLVATRLTAIGIHTGELMGIPPTGAQVTVTETSIVRIADGKIVELWHNYDELGMMQQMGVVDPAGREDYSWGVPSEVTGDPGDPEANKTIVARFLDETWNQQNLGAVDELMSPDIVEHLATGGISVGIEAQKQTMTGYFATFPDIHVTINDMVAEGDKVAKRWTCTGTHQGELMGIPPTGRQVTFTGITIYRFADSKIVELWWAWDVMGMMQQLTAPSEKDYSNVFFMSLSPGLNMISVPLEPFTPFTARSLAAEMGATVVIKYDRSLGRFKGFTPAAPNDGFPIEGGEGYIVNVPEARTVAFTGAAWTNEPPVVSAAPSARINSAWAFVVSGSVLDGDVMSASDGDYTAVVKSIRTGDTFSEAVDTSGYFAAAWADLNRKAVIGAGDKVEVAVADSSGNIVSGPFIHDITLDSIRNAVVNVRLKLGDIIPAESALLQNYPNPFNPETWIPYQLAGPADVTIAIYGTTGQLVRRLDIGSMMPGHYADKSSAAYWDGRNEAGEQVSSGLYFYTIQTGDFTATKKMVVAR